MCPQRIAKEILKGQSNTAVIIFKNLHVSVYISTTIKQRKYNHKNASTNAIHKASSCFMWDPTVLQYFCPTVLTNILSFVKLKGTRRKGTQYTLRWLEMHLLFKSEILDEWYDLGNVSESGKITLNF